MLVNSCQVMQSDFLEEMAQDSKDGRSIVTPKKRESHGTSRHPQCRRDHHREREEVS